MPKKIPPMRFIFAQFLTDLGDLMRWDDKIISSNPRWAGLVLLICVFHGCVSDVIPLLLVISRRSVGVLMDVSNPSACELWCECVFYTYHCWCVVHACWMLCIKYMLPVCFTYDLMDTHACWCCKCIHLIHSMCYFWLFLINNTPTTCFSGISLWFNLIIMKSNLDGWCVLAVHFMCFNVL